MTPGKILADLAVAVALGGDCLADVAVLRSQPELAGSVASDPVISRLISALAAEGPRALRAIRRARAAPRERAWALAGERAPCAGGGLIPVDLDATIVLTHSEEEKAAPTWKGRMGSIPLRRSPTMAPGRGALSAPTGAHDERHVRGMCPGVGTANSSHATSHSNE